jgi:hypothetical protein
VRLQERSPCHGVGLCKLEEGGERRKKEVRMEKAGRVSVRGLVTLGVLGALAVGL